MDLKEALLTLDPENDDLWTSTGLPSVEAVKDAMGGEGVTRADIEAAAPGFTRGNRAGLAEEVGEVAEASPTSPDDGVENESTEPDEPPDDPLALIKAELESLDSYLVDAKKRRADLDRDIVEASRRRDDLSRQLQAQMPRVDPSEAVRAYHEAAKKQREQRGQEANVLNTLLRRNAQASTAGTSRLDQAMAARRRVNKSRHRNPGGLPQSN